MACLLRVLVLHKFIGLISNVGPNSFLPQMAISDDFSLLCIGLEHPIMLAARLDPFHKHLMRL